MKDTDVGAGRSRHRLAGAFVAVVGAALLAVTALATPAAASTALPAGAAQSHLTVASSRSVVAFAAPSGCTSGNLCFWVNANFNDGPGRLSGLNQNWSVF